MAIRCKYCIFLRENAPAALNNWSKSKGQHAMENYLKPFFFLSQVVPIFWSLHRSRTHKWTRHYRGITARMWHPRPHLELSPVCLKLLVRGTNTPIVSSITMSLVTAIIDKNIMRTFVVFHCFVCDSGEEEIKARKTLETNEESTTEWSHKMCWAHSVSVSPITLQGDKKDLLFITI